MNGKHSELLYFYWRRAALVNAWFVSGSIDISCVGRLCPALVTTQPYSLLSVSSSTVVDDPFIHRREQRIRRQWEQGGSWINKNTNQIRINDERQMCHRQSRTVRQIFLLRMLLCCCYSCLTKDSNDSVRRQGREIRKISPATRHVFALVFILLTRIWNWDRLLAKKVSACRMPKEWGRVDGQVNSVA